MSELAQELNPTGKPGGPRKTSGEARKTLCIEPHPDYLIQAAGLYQKRDRLCLSRPGDCPGQQAEAQNQDEAPQILITLDQNLNQPAPGNQSAGMDLSHPRLREYLWHQIDHALLVWPDASPLMAAVQKLSEKPMRLATTVLSRLDQHRGLFLPMLAAWSDMAIALRSRIAKLAATELDLLITGGPSSGREALALWTHELSGRRHHPLEVVDCAGVGEDQLRVELLGCVQGAIVLDTEERQGLLEAGRDGTVILLNLDRAGARLQAEIVRMMRTKRYRRVGESGAKRRLNSRVLATARDVIAPELELAPAQARVRLPRPAELEDDLHDVAVYLAHRLADDLGQAADLPGCLTWLAANRAVLAAHDWPGGYPELIRLVRERLLFPDKDDAFPGRSGVQHPGRGLPPALPGEAGFDPANELMPLAQVVTEYVRRADRSRGDMSRKELARKLDISPNTLYRHLKA